MSVGVEVDFSQYFQIGEGFARWKRLAEAGLMAPSNVVQFLPEFNPVANGCALWGPVSASNHTLLIHFQQNCAVRWQNIPFTRAGREIGSLLPQPDYPGNLRAMGMKLRGVGVSRIELHTVGLPVEVVFGGD